jgi:hypothetical protein
MKARVFVEVKAHIAGASKSLSQIIDELSKSDDLNEKAEVELATEVEYVIDKLRAVANLFRTRQEDREEEEGEDGEDGEEWKKRHHR